MGTASRTRWPCAWDVQHCRQAGPLLGIAGRSAQCTAHSVAQRSVASRTCATGRKCRWRMKGTSMVGGLLLLPCSGTYSAFTWRGGAGRSGGHGNQPIQRDDASFLGGTACSAGTCCSCHACCACCAPRPAAVACPRRSTPPQSSAASSQTGCCRSTAKGGAGGQALRVDWSGLRLGAVSPFGEAVQLPGFA